MKKHHPSLLVTSLTGFLLAGSLVSLNAKRELRPGDFVPEQNAYFVEKIDDPAGLVKAHKYVTPTDDQYNSQKTRSLGSGLIGDIESVWSSYTGKGTTVAIIDDGFDYDHPEYTRKDGTSAILPTSRYYYASGNSAYYKEYSSEPDCIAEDWESDEKEWATHGTNTSTTAAAPMNNGGGVGIAPDADILALKIDFSFVAIKAAIQYAISQNVDVINMSLGAYAESFTDGWGDSQNGSSSTSTYLNSVCQNAYNAGIIVVAAAGNESTWHKSYPACNTKVIGVGALGDWDNKGNATALAEFTNYVGSSQTGEINVDILAPGYVYTATQGGKTSSSHTHTYSDTQGTSFSCPIVAGAACLWKEKYPNGTPDQFLSQLQSTADGIGYYTNKYVPVSGWVSSLSDVGPSNITNGRLNVAKLMDIDEPFVETVQSSLSISVGEMKQINLQTSNGTITYSSSNTSVATVSNTGLVEGKGAGNTTITVTATKGTKTATDTVSVTVAAVVATTSLTFSPKAVTLEIGETYDSAETITLTPSNASHIFLFESENESVATVDEDTGLITAIAPGTATINAVAVHGSGDDSLVVTVPESTSPTSWDKVTTTSDVTNGDYLIVYEDGNKAFNGGLSTLDATNNTISVSISSNSIACSSATEAAKFTINAVSGGFSIKSASGKYIGRSANSNGLDSSTSEAYVNTITISSGKATITGVGGKVLAFNTASDQQRFRYVGSGGNIQLYKAAGGSVPTPTVTGVSVTPSSLSLDVYSNKSGSLSATVSGSNNPSQTVTWTSLTTSVATVSSSGVVTAVSAGTATIRATSTVDNTKFGECTVTVTDSTPAKTLSSISISGYKTSFTLGDTFSFGGTVTAHYSDSSSANVTVSATFTGYNMSVAGNYTVTVSYTYSDVTKTATYQITVSESTGIGTFIMGWGEATGSSGTYENYTATSGSFSGILSFTTAQNGSTNAPYYSSNDNKLRLYYSSSGNGNGGSITITPLNGITFTGFTMTTLTSPTVKYSVDGGSLTTVSCSNNTYIVTGFTASSSITIKNANTTNVKLDIKTIAITYTLPAPKIVSGLTATYSGAKLYVGDSLDLSKLSVTASYTESIYVDETLASSEYELSGYSSTSAGNKTVTVTYTGSLETQTSPMTTTFSVVVYSNPVTSITATCSKSFHPGETISKSDITLTVNYESGKVEHPTDFTFVNDGYMFTYADAPSGGTSGSKEFVVRYNDTNYSFTVTVSRNAYQTISGSTKTLSSSQFASSDVSKSSNTASKTNVTIGGVAFTVTTNAYIFTQNNVNYLSFNTTAGSIQNTNAFVSDLSSVSFTQKSSGRQDGVLSVSKNGIDWVVYSSQEIAKGGYRYFKIEYTGNGSGLGAARYSNIESISYTLAAQDNPTNVANFIMYTDTNGQCVSKLTPAIEKLNTMSSADKNLFWTSNDYVIASARERLQAWAVHEGKTLSYSGGAFTVSNSANHSLINISDGNNIMLIVLIIGLTSATAFGGYMLFIKKKA